MGAVDRREALKMFGAGLFVLGSGVHYQRRTEAQGVTSIPNPTPGTPAGSGHTDETGPNPAPWGLLAPLTAGSALLDGRVVGMTGVEKGLVNVTVERREGSRFRIRICRRDDSASAPKPVARSAYYDFFLPNGGKGDKLTDERDGLAVMALASVVERNETTQAQLRVETLREHWRRAA